VLPPDGRYDAVLLECGAGDGPAQDGHHCLDDVGRSLAWLRAEGAVHVRTRLVAVHLSHRNPPGPELDRRLAAFGAVAGRDGQTMELAAAQQEPRPARRVLITGGARSGKSAEAERRLLAHPDVTYVATSLPRPGDAEWADRVALHRARRPATWRTAETLDVAAVLRAAAPGSAVLVDCATLWLGARLDEPHRDADTDQLVEAFRATRAEVVVVTNEVGSGVVAPTPQGRAFADALGVLNARLAAVADEVWHVVAGCPVRLR
jgi:adenosylcobinamide kinase/adenosylcobinamide-phosphate guanylyltransferase